MPELTPHEVFAKGARAWQAMRAKNGVFNLRFRLKELKKQRPELAKRMAFASKVVRVGWAVVVPPKQEYAFTVGLAHLHGGKDLLLHVPGLKASGRKALEAELNALAAEVIEGKRVPAHFEVFRDADLALFPCEALVEFEWLFADVHHTRGGSIPLLRATTSAA